MKRTPLIHILTLVAFLFNLAGIVPVVHASTLGLPNPGAMVNLSPAYTPVLVKGLKVHPENPLLFDFILDTGKSGLKVNSPEFKTESEKLIKYFLASLTIKEDDLWVNLSPYEKDRIVPDELGKTELGRDMLAQDYILKQLTASLIYPEKQLGKEFWNKVYAKAQQMFNTSDIPVNTFNKVWIIADKAKILERNNVGYVVGSHLKVMLEEDYMALGKHSGINHSDNTHTIASQIVREIIIPELEKEVNQGQNFAPLRQMFYSMILASWYKLALKDALLNQVYSNKAKTGGILSDDSAVKEKIYEQYLKAYKKGVFNYIKEDLDAVSKQQVPRKYFSGGLAKDLGIPKILDRAQTATPEEISSMGGDLAMATVNMTKNVQGSKNPDAAMLQIGNGDNSNQLPTPKIVTPAESLYQRTVDTMFEETIVSYGKAGYRKVEHSHNYVWQHQAEFAGELLAHPATFETGRVLLEDAYEKGIAISPRSDADGWEVNQTLEVATEVIKQMGRHPKLRERAIQLIFDPRTYGISEGSAKAQGFKQTKETIGPERQLTSGSQQEIELVEPRIEPKKGLLALARDWVRGSIATNLPVPSARPASLPMQRPKPMLKDVNTISRIRGLIFELIKMIGNNDVQLSNKLLDTYMTLRQWEIDATRAEGNKYYDYTSQKISDLQEFKGLLPKLTEMADAVDDKEEQGNAYFTLYRVYAENQQPVEALKILSKAKSISHVVYNRAFALTSADKELREKTLTEIRRLGGDQEIERLIIVGNVAFEKGERKEAEKIYKEAWEKSKRLKVQRLSEEYQNHSRNVAEYFIDVARKSGLKFDGMGEVELLEVSRQVALLELNNYDKHPSAEHWIMGFVDDVVFGLAKSGLYPEAEELVLLKDSKSRGVNVHYRPEERDKGYKQMAVGAAYRQDYTRIDEYLRKMVEYKPDAMLAITKVFGQKGDFENSFIASVLGANQIVSRGGIARDKDDIGVSTRVLFMDKGESLYELGQSMLEHGFDSQKVGKLFVKAAEVGLGDSTLTRLMQTIRNHPELRPFIVDILQNALQQNHSIIKHQQHAVILESLREFSPELIDFEPQIDFSKAESPGDDKAMAGELTRGGIDLNAKNMGLEVAKQGRGVEMKFDPAMVAEFQRGDFSGIVPVIIRITPIVSALPILGLE